MHKKLLEGHTDGDVRLFRRRSEKGVIFEMAFTTDYTVE